MKAKSSHSQANSSLDSHFQCSWNRGLRALSAGGGGLPLPWANVWMGPSTPVQVDRRGKHEEAGWVPLPPLATHTATGPRPCG